MFLASKKCLKKCLSQLYLNVLLTCSYSRSMLYGSKDAPTASLSNALKNISFGWINPFLLHKTQSPHPLEGVQDAGSLYEKILEQQISWINFSKSTKITKHALCGVLLIVIALCRVILNVIALYTLLVVTKNDIHNKYQTNII